MAKVTWKRTRHGIEFIEKKSALEKMQDLTFMQTSLSIFALEVLLFLGALAWAIATGGNAAWPVSLLGIAILLLGAAGVFVTLYGHFSVEAESAIDWRIGIYTNGASVLCILILTILGLVKG